MKSRLLKAVPVSILLSLSLQSMQSFAATFSTVYQTNFEAGGDASWSNIKINSLSNLFDDEFYFSKYLGGFGQNETTTLTVQGLPDHNQLSLQFDLYVIGSWDGEDPRFGRDFFSMTGDIVGSWTFTNHQIEGQTYPGSPDEFGQLYDPANFEDATAYMNATGFPIADHIYRGFDPTGLGDEFLITHSADAFTITFGGPTTQAFEWWGIDNVQVSVATVVPIPPAIWLFGSGLLGLVGMARRKAALAGT